MDIRDRYSQLIIDDLIQLIKDIFTSSNICYSCQSPYCELEMTSHSLYNTENIYWLCLECQAMINYIQYENHKNFNVIK